MGQGAAGSAFTGGGVSPEQAAFAQYTRGQNTIEDLGAYGQVPDSTMQTQAISGATAGQAFNLGHMSDALAAAQAQFANAQQQASKGATSQGIGLLGKFAGKGG